MRIVFQYENLYDLICYKHINIKFRIMVNEVIRCQKQILIQRFTLQES